ncbi:MAG: hypothetical protein ACJ72T_02515, partial [Nitrososphaeraceae archaeon]
NNNNFAIINVQNVVLSTNAKKIAVKCHFCMMCAICVKKGVFILILGSIYKNNLLVTSSFLYKYFLSSSSSLPFLTYVI